MKLCSVEDVKLFLDKTDSDHDPLLDKMVDFTSKLMESAMNGRLLKKEARTKYFNPGGRIYLLPAFPVDTTATITVTADGTTQVINDDYYLYDETGIIEFGVDQPWADPKDIVVTWSGGYTESTGSGILDVPDDLEFACMMQTSYFFRRRKDLGTSYILMPDGAASIPVKEGLIAPVREIVDRYALVYV
jgi:hypothetical protein